MKKGIILGVFMMNLIPGMARADYPGHCPDGHCNPPTKDACFNLVCTYKDKDHDDDKGFKFCKVAAKFNKAVTLDGGEVEDDSNHKNNPQFEVWCDGNMIFNNSARRFTDLLGTRIQGESGPYPAVTLPRGALHSGTDHSSGHHVAWSALEVDNGHKVERLKGTCHIWSGAP